MKKYYIQKYNLVDFDYYIFGGLKPLAPTTINRHKKNACLKANIRPIKLHEFRHSHATLLHSKNVSLQSIKERLGHSNINVTMNVYVHLTDRHKKRITRILNLLRLKY
ncbi:MAG: tyrosine-type recombinase/integrase [Bacilli bacterium]|nr:tyrosine-type recombinase/integrase [Bacilli bacterium]